MTAGAFVNVITRYVVQYSLAFTEEIVVSLFVWLTLLGSAVAFREGSHLAFTYLVDRAPPAGRRAALWLSATLSVLLFVLLIYYGLVQIGSGRSRSRSGGTRRASPCSASSSSCGSFNVPSASRGARRSDGSRDPAVRALLRPAAGRRADPDRGGPERAPGPLAVQPRHPGHGRQRLREHRQVPAARDSVLHPGRLRHGPRGPVARAGQPAEPAGRPGAGRPGARGGRGVRLLRRDLRPGAGGPRGRRRG